MTNVILYTPTQRQAMARLLVKNIPGSIERKKKQLEELQAEIAVLEYNLREAERILSTVTPPSQPGVGGGGEPDDAGVAKIATPVKLTANQRHALEQADCFWGVWNRCKANTHLHTAALQVLRKLEKMGLVEPINAGDTRWSVQYTTTDAGAAFLKAVQS